MAEFALIKNGRHVIARAGSGAALRTKALELIAKHPGASYEAVKILRRVRTDKTPPSYVVIDEDIS